MEGGAKYKTVDENYFSALYSFYNYLAFEGLLIETILGVNPNTIVTYEARKDGRRVSLQFNKS
ncbi:MAG: hypothetical protein QXI48_01665 [Candidatus Bathyarchaeia archaeon]